MSLRRFLLASLSIVIITLLALSLFTGYHNAKEQMDELFDAELAQQAKLLSQSLLLHTDNETLIIKSWHDGEEIDESRYGELAERDKTGHAYENKIAYQLWTPSHRLKLRSATAPDNALAAFDAGFYNVKIQQQEWRVFVLPVNDNGTVMVAQRDDIRSELGSEIAINIILPALLMLPLILLIVTLVIRKATAPLTALAGEIEQRKPHQLNAIALQRAPAEVQPIIFALNEMMQRVQSAFEQQRRFIADAAHELRTPLAALQIHSENATNSSGAEQLHSLQQLQECIARSTHLVAQLLTLEKLEHLGRQHPTTSPISLNAIVQRVVADQQVLLHNRHQQFKIDGAAQCFVHATPAQLTAIVSNICDNASRYSPDGATIQIDLETHSQHVLLRVQDQGPGIAAEHRERVFEPFFREPGQQQIGSGLGLAIVREAVTQLGGEIRLDNNKPNGLIISILLPCT